MDRNTMIMIGVASVVFILIIFLLVKKKEGFSPVQSKPMVSVSVTPEFAALFTPDVAFNLAYMTSEATNTNPVFNYQVVPSITNYMGKPVLIAEAPNQPLNASNSGPINMQIVATNFPTQSTNGVSNYWVNTYAGPAIMKSMF